MKCLASFLFFAALCSSSFSLAQNWKTVRMGDTAYYQKSISSTSGPIHRFRPVFIRAASPSANDTVFYFPYTIRDTSKPPSVPSPCLDTFGAFWMGRSFIHHSNGYDYYFNYRKDTIRIQREAPLASTFLMGVDTGNQQIMGTITAMDSITVDDEPDSVRYCTLTVLKNGNPYPASHLHGKVIAWTKAHGWWQTLDWYLFPASQFFTSTIISNPYDRELFYRVPKKHLQWSSTYENIALKYAPGNTFFYEFSTVYDGNSWWYDYDTYDSVINLQWVNPSTAQVTMYRKSRFTQFHSNGTSYWFTTTWSDSTFTMLKTQYPPTQDPTWYQKPEELATTHLTDPTSINTQTLLAGWACDTLPIIKTKAGDPFFLMNYNGCKRLGSNISGTTTFENSYVKGIGMVSKRTNTYGNAPMSDTAYILRYARIKGCTYGTYATFPNAIKSIPSSIESSCTIVPNPARGAFTIHFVAKETTAMKIVDAQGAVVWQKQLQAHVSVHGIEGLRLPAGIYFIHLSNSQEQVVRKVSIVE